MSGYGYAPYGYGYYIGQQAAPAPQLVPYESGQSRPRGPLIPGTAVPDPTKTTLDGSLATMRYEDVHRYLIDALKKLDASGAPYLHSVVALLYLAIMEAAQFGYTVSDLQNVVSALMAAQKGSPTEGQVRRRQAAFAPVAGTPTVAGYPWHAVGQAPVAPTTPPPPLPSSHVPPNPQELRWKENTERAAVKAVANAHRQRRARSPFYGYLLAGTQEQVQRFPSVEQAVAWYEVVSDDRVRRQRSGQRSNYDYIAIFDANILRSPVWEEYGHFWDPYEPGRDLPPHLRTPRPAINPYTVWPRPAP